ncbi:MULTISPECIES: helix-turn-helix transcriptional regulator [unclassified Undibacterium]|uniref:helix-turn-helix transcriptional regulator n=1 Tax=unclassified Undibacterium TaxID=2630295 RepID=UPI002AC8FD1A|nr:MULTISPECIES: helix-turn-helix transcriptional regulator [unclassified Undibacterium]MEB0138815.1 helix-turn-helix transcriptional regulator [Undibacterium sp. CCC2.1]MEB0170709.1 helix-turn-helix transcriptional regulator [Undibacterium sp. CCC1.1]MEB0174598.1 helix-turn-helix transcriptional regulator [Undibacterium sp. CCC3.4]MEB0213795.1 helix-turn-helix transcriptional regulator [Undibacterium sp. 5I2]WPX42523.1 helix-turn-helix transcriptional regulator [Undibacterium sp. CCC3.4]
MSTIIEQLVNVREVKHLSQTAFAEKAGLNRMTVARTELGKIDPRLSTILVMARALGLDLMLVPKELKQALEEFIQSGGKYVGQAPGVEAPLSIVDAILSERNA